MAIVIGWSELNSYYERAVIKKILVHLKQYSEPVQLRAPPALAGDYTESVEYVSYDDGWPGYEEAAVDVNSQ